MQIKNWDPLVLGPALAMDRIPFPTCYLVRAKEGVNKIVCDARKCDAMDRLTYLQLKVLISKLDIVDVHRSELRL